MNWAPNAQDQITKYCRKYDVSLPQPQLLFLLWNIKMGNSFNGCDDIIWNLAMASVNLEFPSRKTVTEVWIPKLYQVINIYIIMT